MRDDESESRARTVTRIGAVVACVGLLIALMPPSVGVVAAQPGAYEPPPDANSLVPIVSTRGHFRLNLYAQLIGGAELTDGHTADDYATSGAVPGIDTTCADEIVVYVHGHANGEQAAITNFNTAYRSLRSNGYQGPVVGYSWDSNTPIYWGLANRVAQKNGVKLATFIGDYHEACSNAHVRVIAHSLGTVLVLNATNTLDRRYGVVGPHIHSAHFIGSAAHSDAISYWNGYGDAVEGQVYQLHNKYSRNDGVLKYMFRVGEFTRLNDFTSAALGHHGARRDVVMPVNYHEQDVSAEVAGHSDYVGGLDENGNLVHDGAMNFVVADWRNEARLAERQPPSPSIEGALTGAVERFEDAPGIARFLFRQQDIDVHVDRDDLVGDAYRIETGFYGDVVGVSPYYRYVIGHDPLMVGTQVTADGTVVEGVYKPAGAPTSSIYFQEPSLYAVTQGCAPLDRYRAGLAAGTIRQRLDTTSQLRYETLVKRAPEIARTLRGDRPNDRGVGRCT